MTGIETSRAGWNELALAQVLEQARAAGSTDVCILQRGQVVVDEWWEPGERARAVVVETLPDGRVRQDMASVQKSIVSVLVGIAVARGLLDLEDPVDDWLGPGWAGPQAVPGDAPITVRHLLTMTSGLGDDGTRIAAPGARWDYNLGAAYHSTKRVVAAAARATIDDVTADWLTGPLGMTDTSWIRRAWAEGTPEVFRHVFLYPDGEPVEALCSTARDLARFGQGVLTDIATDGAVLGIDPGYRRAMTSRSQPHNPAYGMLWWCNAQDWFLAPKDPTRHDGPYLPGVPADAFAALGLMDRLCVVVPSLDLVITRAGAAAAGGAAAASRFTVDFVAGVRAACPG